MEILNGIGKEIRPTSNVMFGGFALLSFVVSVMPLAELLAFSLKSSVYSYVPFVPPAAAFLLFSERKTIFVSVRPNFVIGIPLLVSAFVLCTAISAHVPQFAPDIRLFLASLSLVTFWIGGFILFYGIDAFRNAAFPLLFLLFMVPLPNAVLDMVIVTLQQGSFVVAYWLFKIVGVKVSCSGFVISLPVFDIEVAKECSGIRSSLSLLVMSLVAGHLFLKSPSKKVLLALSVIPVAIFKNAVRMVTLSLIGMFVDEKVFSSALHRSGGIVFFMPAMLLLILTLVLLRRSEEARSHADSVSYGTN